MVDAASECGSEVPHNSSKPWTPLPTPPKWPTGPQWLRVRMTGSSDFPIFVWGRNEQNFQAGFFQSRWSKSHKLVSLQGITLPSTHNLSKLTTFSNSKEKELLPKNEFVFAESYYVTYCLGTCNKLRKTTVTGVHPDWADRPSLLLTAASVAVDKSIHSQFGSLKFTRQLIVWLEILNIYIYYELIISYCLGRRLLPDSQLYFTLLFFSFWKLSRSLNSYNWSNNVMKSIIHFRST